MIFVAEASGASWPAKWDGVWMSASVPCCVGVGCGLHADGWGIL